MAGYILDKNGATITISLWHGVTVFWMLAAAAVVHGAAELISVKNGLGSSRGMTVNVENPFVNLADTRTHFSPQNADSSSNKVVNSTHNLVLQWGPANAKKSPVSQPSRPPVVHKWVPNFRPVKETHWGAIVQALADSEILYTSPNLPQAPSVTYTQASTTATTAQPKFPILIQDISQLHNSSRKQFHTSNLMPTSRPGFLISNDKTDIHHKLILDPLHSISKLTLPTDFNPLEIFLPEHTRQNKIIAKQEGSSSSSNVKVSQLNNIKEAIAGEPCSPGEQVRLVKTLSSSEPSTTPMNNPPCRTNGPSIGYQAEFIPMMTPPTPKVNHIRKLRWPTLKTINPDGPTIKNIRWPNTSEEPFESLAVTDLTKPKTKANHEISQTHTLKTQGTAWPKFKLQAPHPYKVSNHPQAQSKASSALPPVVIRNTMSYTRKPSTDKYIITTQNKNKNDNGNNWVYNKSELDETNRLHDLTTWKQEEKATKKVTKEKAENHDYSSMNTLGKHTSTIYYENYSEIPSTSTPSSEHHLAILELPGNTNIDQPVKLNNVHVIAPAPKDLPPVPLFRPVEKRALGSTPYLLHTQNTPIKNRTMTTPILSSQPVLVVPYTPEKTNPHEHSNTPYPVLIPMRKATISRQDMNPFEFFMRPIRNIMNLGSPRNNQNSVRFPPPNPQPQIPFQQPVSQISSEQPISQTSFQQPAFPNSFQQPVSQTSFQQPVSQTSFQQPESQTSFQQPVQVIDFGPPKGEDVVPQTPITVASSSVNVPQEQKLNSQVLLSPPLPASPQNPHQPSALKSNPVPSSPDLRAQFTGGENFPPISLTHTQLTEKPQSFGVFESEAKELSPGHTNPHHAEHSRANIHQSNVNELKLVPSNMARVNFTNTNVNLTNNGIPNLEQSNLNLLNSNQPSQSHSDTSSPDFTLKHNTNFHHDTTQNDHQQQNAFHFSTNVDNIPILSPISTESFQSSSSNNFLQAPAHSNNLRGLNPPPQVQLAPEANSPQSPSSIFFHTTHSSQENNFQISTPTNSELPPQSAIRQTFESQDVQTAGEPQAVQPAAIPWPNTNKDTATDQTPLQELGNQLMSSLQLSNQNSAQSQGRPSFPFSLPRMPRMPRIPMRLPSLPSFMNPRNIFRRQRTSRISLDRQPQLSKTKSMESFTNSQNNWPYSNASITHSSTKKPPSPKGASIPFLLNIRKQADEQNSVFKFMPNLQPIMGSERSPPNISTSSVLPSQSQSHPQIRATAQYFHQVSTTPLPNLQVPTFKPKGSAAPILQGAILEHHYQQHISADQATLNQNTNSKHQQRVPGHSILRLPSLSEKNNRNESHQTPKDKHQLQLNTSLETEKNNEFHTENITDILATDTNSHSSASTDHGNSVQPHDVLKPIVPEIIKFTADDAIHSNDTLDASLDDNPVTASGT